MDSLVIIPCPTCGGDAYLEDERGQERCVTCNATGSVEVCACCGEVPNVINDLEVCGCAVVELARAA